MATLFQAGTLISMLQTVYDGDINFATLAQQGDTGLGTFNGVDGELIALDGQFYRVNVDGVVNQVTPETCTPFAVVSRFQADTRFNLENINSFNDLSTQLDQHISTPNIFYMMRLEAELSWIKIRSEACQTRPYKPMTETMPLLQKTYELTNSTGTLIALRCPSYMAALNVPGYHLHYINQQKSTGGHVFDLKIKKATVMMQALRNFSMALFNTKEFDQADLEVDVTHATHQVEKS